MMKCAKVSEKALGASYVMAEKVRVVPKVSSAESERKTQT